MTKCSISVLKNVVNIGGDGKAAGPLKTGPIGCAETTLTMLRDVPEEQIFYLHGGGSMKSSRAVNIITIVN